MPRPLDLLDLPTLYRYRDEALSLDSARLLTRGNPLGALGFVSYFNPARHLYSAVASEKGTIVLGGISQTFGDSFARLLYLTPTSQLTHPGLPSLIEHLSAEAGNWGALHILAEVDEDSLAFSALRQAGFSVYAWQRIWDVSAITAQPGQNGWEKVQPVNLVTIQNLFHQIVPPLLQVIEPPPRRAVGLICNEGAKCYINLSYGMAGILLTPLIHPEATDVAEKLASLLGNLRNRRNRPVYLCVRSYQAWLESALEDLGAKASPRQAVMVKHLARLVKDEQAIRTAQPVRVVPASRITRAHLQRDDLFQFSRF
jgi:hypothetical protein